MYCVAGDPGSQVWGSVREGVFEGVVHSERDGTYYVERANKYFPGHNSTRAGFHSVIYHDNHVDDPYAKVRQGHRSGCGATDEIAAWMESIQNSADPSADSDEEEEEEVEEVPLDPLQARKHKYKKWLEEHEEYRAVQEDPDLYHNNLAGHEKYTARANKRVKRAAGIAVGQDNKGTCSLSIQTDPMLWHHIYIQVWTCLVFLQWFLNTVVEVDCLENLSMSSAVWRLLYQSFIPSCSMTKNV